MRTVFIDTNHFVAVFNPADQWHVRALEVERGFSQIQFVTSELVLIETLNYFSNYRANVKSAVAQSVRPLFSDPDIEVVLHTQDGFYAALALYESRLDKGYSLIDCISMNIMRERGIMDVLTHDHHFSQEGFSVLL
jgi:predicted nucleic acid-binding protein